MSEVLSTLSVTTSEPTHGSAYRYAAAGASADEAEVLLTLNDESLCRGVSRGLAPCYRYPGTSRAIGTPTPLLGETRCDRPR